MITWFLYIKWIWIWSGTLARSLANWVQVYWLTSFIWFLLLHVMDPLNHSAHWLCAHIFAYESRKNKTYQLWLSEEKQRESVLSGIFQIPRRLECFPHIKDVGEFAKPMSNKQKGTVVVTSRLIQAFNVRVMFPLWPTDTLFWDLWLFDMIWCFYLNSNNFQTLIIVLYSRVIAN